MMTLLTQFLVLILVAAPVFARSANRSISSHPRITVTRSRSIGAHTHSTKCASCARDNHGKIKRSPTAKRDFQRSNPCPSTGRTAGACPGYVIDHQVALKRGGADEPGNMQWQSRTAARAKDRVE
jgi:hypothetical protein